jgi:glc operon protein GlcG
MRFTTTVDVPHGGDCMITLERALSLIGAGQAAARREGLALAFAVVDAGGHLVALHRMDGAPWIAPEVAIGKAWTAAAYGTPSAAQGEKMRELHAFSAAVSAATGGRFTPQIGALPITDGDAVIGAMGASGGTGQQDEDAVRAALEA